MIAVYYNQLAGQVLHCDQLLSANHAYLKTFYKSSNGRSAVESKSNRSCDGDHRVSVPRRPGPESRRITLSSRSWGGRAFSASGLVAAPVASRRDGDDGDWDEKSYDRIARSRRSSPCSRRRRRNFARKLAVFVACSSHV